MMIVFISPHADPQAKLGEPDAGGQCLYEHQLAQALAKRGGCKVVVYCRYTGRRPKQTNVLNNYTIRRIEVGGSNFIPKENLERILPEFTDKLAARFKPDESTVIHAHYWDGGRVALQLISNHFPDVPLVWTPHSLGAAKRREFKGTRNEMFYNFLPRLTWEGYAAFASDAVIVSSGQEKQEIMEDYAMIEDGKLAVSPPGIDFEDLEEVEQRKARSRLRIPQEDKVILCLGRITPYKGYHHAIRAVKHLADVYSNSVRLVIVGGSANNLRDEEAKYIKHLQQLSKSLDIEDRVVFMPAVSHKKVATVMSAADVYLMSSEHEPFGMTVLEAMAVGRPTVASNAGGPLDLISHNTTGILVDIHKPERVAGYMRALLKDEEYYDSIAKNAREFVWSEFSWDKRADEFMSIYKGVLKRRKGPYFHRWVNNNYFLEKNLKTR